MPAIFVSYAREDHAAVKTLVEGLKNAGHEVWWDERLGAGERFAESIEEQLQLAAVVLVVWSQRAKSSRWVLDEAERGVQRGVLLPLRIDGARLPLGFGGFNVLDFSSWGGDFDTRVWRTLLDEIHRLRRAPSGPGKRPAINALPGAFAVGIGWGTAVGGLLWGLHALQQRGAATESVLGHPIIDSIVLGCIGTAPVALWSAIEVQRAGFEKRPLIVRRTAKWFLVGSLFALIVLVVAVSAGAVRAGSPREIAAELAQVFVALTTAAAFVLTTFSLLHFLARRFLGK